MQEILRNKIVPETILVRIMETRFKVKVENTLEESQSDFKQNGSTQNNYWLNQ